MVLTTKQRLAASLVCGLLLTSAWAGGDPVAGKEKSAVCAGCHGVDGNSTIGANPRLAGQYESYLYHSLKEYKDGRRDSLLMAGMVANLTDEDLQDLAAYFASQDTGTLVVLPDD
jgi:cytochrome c553